MKNSLQICQNILSIDHPNKAFLKIQVQKPTFYRIYFACTSIIETILVPKYAVFVSIYLSQLFECFE